jgi:hypothetical protein
VPAALVLGLSTSQKVGLLIVAGAFIAFALVSSFLLPARWPEFPGKSGLVPFIVICVLFFVGMMLAVFFLAKEEEEPAEHEEAAPGIVQVAAPVAAHRFRLTRG